MTESVSESENPAIPSPTPKASRPRTNLDWWPNQLDLRVLHQHSPLSDPMGEDFTYAEEFKTLDLDALKRDLIERVAFPSRRCGFSNLLSRVGLVRVDREQSTSSATSRHREQ